MLEHTVVSIEILLLAAGLVAMLAQRLHVPYTVGLVAAGAAAALLPAQPPLALSKDLIFSVLLPPLIFEAALNLRWRELRREALVVSVFASAGVVLSMGVVAVSMHALAGWSWMAAAVFGALISATDPVSVIALFKDMGVHGRLRLLTEAESLLNDGTAAVAFTLALAATAGASLGAVDAGLQLLRMVAGGIACGGMIAGALLLMAGRTEDPLIEITFTTVAAFGSFLAAERLHCSGVLATLTAGLMMGNLGSLGPLSARGRQAALAFWDYLAFAANSLIFLLIGLHEAHQALGGALAVSALAVLAVLAGRAAAIYPLALLFRRSAWRIPLRQQHALFWGGLRGALALALVLGLPADMPGRETLVTVTFAVVTFSIVAQGLTTPALLRRLGELGSRKPSGS